MSVTNTSDQAVRILKALGTDGHAEAVNRVEVLRFRWQQALADRWAGSAGERADSSLIETRHQPQDRAARARKVRQGLPDPEQSVQHEQTGKIHCDGSTGTDGSR